MKPAGMQQGWVEVDHRGAKQCGQKGCRGHDVPKEFVFHDAKAIEANLIIGHGVVDEQSGQVE